MKIFNFVNKLRKKPKKTEIEIEQEIEEEIIKENLQEEEKITAIIIEYIIDENSEIPKIKKICNFHSELLPEQNSIIWAPNSNQTRLLPYKVLRLDFIEDLDTDAKNFIYIVVKPALLNDIAVNYDNF